MLKEQEKNCAPKLGSLAPDFTADTTKGEIKLSDYKGRWIVISRTLGTLSRLSLCCIIWIIGFKSIS
jgi:hypothetical protein